MYPPLSVLVFIGCWLTSGTPQQAPFPLFQAIDHVPVVVDNLDSAIGTLEGVLRFKVKAGRAHEGIKNCFVKFRDGSYLEFTTPLNDTQPMGQYYSNALRKRQGGVTLAVAVHSTDSLVRYLEQRKLPYEVNENRVWKTVLPKKEGLFYIEYANKNWREAKENTEHPNTALSLRSTFIFTSNQSADADTYCKYGFKKAGEGHFMGIPYTLLSIGNSNLYLLNAEHTHQLSPYLSTSHLSGIAGFEIAVESLVTVSELLSIDVLRLDDKKLIAFLEAYNTFLVFSE